MYMYHGTSRHTCISCFHHPPHTIHSMLASTSFINQSCTRAIQSSDDHILCI